MVKHTNITVKVDQLNELDAREQRDYDREFIAQVRAQPGFGMTVEMKRIEVQSVSRHATLQGYLLRHRSAFTKLLETAEPVEMWLRCQMGQPRFNRRGKPGRWNA
eukprot:2961402-Amphidinium_carterae.1